MNFQTLAAGDIPSHRSPFHPRLSSAVKVEEEMGLQLCLHCCLPGTLTWYNMGTLLSSTTSAMARVPHLGLVNTNIQGSLANILNLCIRICQSLSVTASLSAGFRTEGRWRALHLQSKNSTDCPGFTKLYWQKEPEAWQRNPTAPWLWGWNSVFKHIALILLYWDSWQRGSLAGGN